MITLEKLKNKGIENVLQVFKDVFDKTDDSDIIITKRGYYFITFGMEDDIEYSVKITEPEQLISLIKKEMEFDYQIELNKNEMVDNSLSSNEREEFEKKFKTYYDAYLLSHK